MLTGSPLDRILNVWNDFDAKKLLHRQLLLLLLLLLKLLLLSTLPFYQIKTDLNWVETNNSQDAVDADDDFLFSLSEF